MQPAVIARIKIDNFLLGLPHLPEVYNQTDSPLKGGLIDTSFYGTFWIKTWWIVLCLHLGRDGYNHREKRDHFKQEDINWNVQYVPNFRKSRSSLIYADFVFRKYSASHWFISSHKALLTIECLLKTTEKEYSENGKRVFWLIESTIHLRLKTEWLLLTTSGTSHRSSARIIEQVSGWETNPLQDSINRL